MYESQVMLFIEDRPSCFLFAYGTWSMSNCMDGEKLGVCKYFMAAVYLRQVYTEYEKVVDSYMNSIAISICKICCQSLAAVCQ